MAKKFTKTKNMSSYWIYFIQFYLIVFSFQEHVANHAPNKILEVDEFLALRKEVRHMLKHDSSSNDQSSDAPPGEGEEDSVAVSLLFTKVKYLLNV